MSKKILSLALAVIMLFSVCAVAASAVQGDGTETIALVRLRFPPISFPSTIPSCIV